MAKQQGGGGGQQGGGDSSMGPIWVMVLLLFTVFFIWKLAHQYIVAFVFYLNILQGKLVSFFINDPVLKQTIYIMQTIDPAAVSWDQFLQLTRIVGDYIRYPVLISVIFLGIVLYRSDIKLKFRKAHSMKTLRAQEQNNWLAIMPVVKEDLIETDINKGPWAMALTPIEFGRKYKLLKQVDPLSTDAQNTEVLTAAIKKADTKRVFTLQLGANWDGFEHCPGHVCALAAVFMARINRDKKAASFILESLDRGYAEGKLDFSIAKPTLDKYVNTPLIQEILPKHAYTLTVMASLLEAARLDGVVPTAEFLWLKPTDRRLWYMLNCIGRQTPFAEVAGPFAHWRAEKVMGRRSMIPMIDEATKALEIAINEVKLSPKELEGLEA